jgi:hypothetical protein
VEGSGVPGQRGVLLLCGQDTAAPDPVDGLRVQRLPARPGKRDVDPLLTTGGDTHLVVQGTDADLAAVVLRLLRKDRLSVTTVGYVPTEPSSAVATLWRLPARPEQALRVALHGDVDPVPLIRDDCGGVLLGRGVVAPVRGVGYCDDDVALRGQARRIEVEPDTDGGAGLTVTVTKGTLFKRTSSFAGRAFQLGCLPAVPVSDGVPYDRPMTRWTWYRHTQDLRLVRGLV